MNSYTVIDLYKEFIQRKFINTGRMHVNLLTHPEHMQIKNLPENHKIILREKYSEVIEWIKLNLPNDSESQIAPKIFYIIKKNYNFYDILQYF
jgi:hypothetical protein